jgi:hypothetical protein
MSARLVLRIWSMATHKHSRKPDEQRAMREASELPQPSIVDIDPEDPAQLLDDAGQFSIVDLEVEAQPHEEADADLDGAVEEADMEGVAEEDEREVDELQASEVDTPSQTTADAYAEEADHTDTGELYGLHMPKAEDREPELTPDQEQFLDVDSGETWLETLDKKSVEFGPEPEEVIDPVDNSDELGGHHSTESGDPPVADKGSGGIGGL